MLQKIAYFLNRVGNNFEKLVMKELDNNIKYYHL